MSASTMAEERLIKDAYTAFNARDLDAALALQQAIEQVKNESA